jgi:hypothetical protein
VPSGSSTHTIASSRAATRATLDHRQGSQRKLRAPRRWLFDMVGTLTTHRIHIRHDPYKADDAGEHCHPEAA